MKRRIAILMVTLMPITALGKSTAAAQEQVIDRIAARVEDDIILMSDLKELGQYQQLMEGQTENDEQLLSRLIDQWIVRKEAETARFPKPNDAEVDRSLQRLKRAFASAADYETHRKRSGLSEADVRRIVTSQVYLDNYLDSRFRPLIHIDPKAVEDFYNNRVVPRAKARGQTPPSFDTASDYIQEALIQRGIDEQAGQWLKESRARIQVKEFLSEGPR